MALNCLSVVSTGSAGASAAIVSFAPSTSQGDRRKGVGHADNKPRRTAVSLNDSVPLMMAHKSCGHPHSRPHGWQVAQQLCETFKLLMAKAYPGRVIMPNRHEDAYGNMFDGHFLASETYVGGHVEAPEAGISGESKCSIDQVTNYDEMKAEVTAAVELMRDNPKRMNKPLIYHSHVAAMDPNIMLSNRLQPDSMADEARGGFFPAHRDECNMIKHALNQETGGRADGAAAQAPGDYSRKVYKKTKKTKVEEREAIVCKSENPFYVDTVRRFCDRRYEYKGLRKTWKKTLDVVTREGRSIAEVDEAKKMIILYDSLQLAHKQNNITELYSLIKILRIKPPSNWYTFNEQIAKPVNSSRGASHAMKKAFDLLAISGPEKDVKEMEAKKAVHQRRVGFAIANEAMMATTKPTEIAVAVHSVDLMTVVALDMPDFAIETVTALAVQDLATNAPCWRVHVRREEQEAYVARPPLASTTRVTM
ncbi:hypothetical protein HYPSUDRAFT_207473 [Hypholoma sublateritium FD-334 SS-4]|uniref:DNA polymerase epsilon catalytic subunit n=1 Tax=Hypholoma sublateritium (strain FD-334 SS-4) TaxID=945553 RepID=A0A0D2LTZ2_HYPSF|nr:hypothetical protein HYPSUDRAFT_208781 [Hypholoma sublateritium FD-334 SS-4]KJA15973.1 hypothetical protein HYPSUDRAFT_207473 [Hypholoma sublateritium FD-334 SS-4]